MEVDVANPKKKKFINQREICHTSWVILVTVAWSVVRTWIRSNNLNTSCKERSPEFKKNPKKKNPMPQLRVTQLCNNNEKLKKFTFFSPFLRKSNYSKRHILFIITCSTSEKTMTPFSPKTLASSLHNIITSDAHHQNSKLALKWKSPTERKE